MVSSYLHASPAVPAAKSPEDGDGTPQLEDEMTNQAMDFAAAESAEGEREGVVPLPSSEGLFRSIDDGVGDDTSNPDDWKGMQEYVGLAGSAVDQTLADEGAMGKDGGSALWGQDGAGALGLLDEQTPTSDLRHVLLDTADKEN